MSKEEYISRGIKVVIKEKAENYIKLVNSTFNNTDLFEYNIMNLEATLKCMEELSNNKKIEEVYELINIHSHDCMYNNYKLSGWQNHAIISVILVFHERGKELANYRNEYIQKIL